MALEWCTGLHRTAAGNGMSPIGIRAHCRRKYRKLYDLKLLLIWKFDNRRNAIKEEIEIEDQVWFSFPYRWNQEYLYPVIRKAQILLVVGAASSRDHLISRLEAAPTGCFYCNLNFPDKRIFIFSLLITPVSAKKLASQKRRYRRCSGINQLWKLLGCQSSISPKIEFKSIYFSSYYYESF